MADEGKLPVCSLIPIGLYDLRSYKLLRSVLFAVDPVLHHGKRRSPISESVLLSGNLRFLF
jgi:hypothetical protein